MEALQALVSRCIRIVTSRARIETAGGEWIPIGGAQTSKTLIAVGSIAGGTGIWEACGGTTLEASLASESGGISIISSRTAAKTCVTVEIGS